MKLIIVSRQPHDDAVLYINNQPIKRTNKFKYLSSTLNDKLNSDEKVKIRMAIAKTIFAKFHKYLYDRGSASKFQIASYQMLYMINTNIRSRNLVTQGQVPQQNRDF